MQPHAIALQAVPAAAHNGRQALVKRIGKGDVPDDAALEEGPRPHALGAVDDLVGHDEVARPHVRLQAADGREGHDVAHAERAQRGDVGAVRDLVRRVLVVEAVPRDKGHRDHRLLLLLLLLLRWRQHPQLLLMMIPRPVLLLLQPILLIVLLLLLLLLILR